MLLVLDLGISSLVLVVSLVLPLIGLFVRHKWRVAAQRREEIRRLLIHASEEAARAELEASVEFSSVAVSNVFHCPVCYCLATTRCSRCKAVRYCSGKCQIIHWRQGHKDECHPASIVYDSEDESDSDLRLGEENGQNTPEETLLVGPEPVTIPIGESLLSNRARSPEDGNGDIADNKDDLIDKEEAVSVAETSGSSFSGFSSSPRNDSGDEISRCESFSSSESERSESLLDAHVSVEPEDTCFSTIEDAPSKLLSPKFVHLVESVDNLANLPKLSVHKPEDDAGQNQSQSRSLHSLVTDRHPVSADPSLKSSDFWGTALGSAERVSDSCVKSKSGRPGNSSLHFSFGSGSSRDTSAAKVSEQRSSILKEAPRGTGYISDGVNLRERNAKRFDEAEIALPISSSTDALSPLDSSNLSHVTLPKSKSASSENGSMLAPLKVGEVQLLASKASNTKKCADLMKHSPLGAKSVRVLDHQKQNGAVVQHINSLHGRSGLKASVLKVVDQWTRPKSENEMAGRHGHKGLFPYEVFAKLYTYKIEFQPCGLINVGNSCFANVVFQCLMFTPPLTTYFLQQFHSRACTKKEQCFTCGFEKLVVKAKEEKSPLSPNGLLSQLQNIGIFLGNGKEEDAHEFLRFVVDTMQSVCIKASEYDMTKSSKLEDTTLIGLTFGGYLRSKIKCMKCQVKSELREKMMDLTVEIDGDISTLDDALRRFTRTEILDGENKYRCGSCKSYERAKKKLKITEPPNVLTIALKRFQAGKFGKLNKLIRFPETLDLAPYVSLVEDEFVSHVYCLCKYGLDSLVRDHFLRSLEQAFEKGGASSFWQHFDAYSEKKHHNYGEEIQIVLCKALEEISIEKQYHEKCLSIVVHALQSFKEQSSDDRQNSDTERVHLFSRFQSMLSSTLMTTLPQHFPEILHWYFKERLEELSAIMDGDGIEEQEDDCMDLDEKLRYKNGEMDVDEGCSQGKRLGHDKLVKNIGKVVRDLRSIGFTSMAENAYASAIFLLLKAKVHDLAGDDYRTSVLESIKEWIQTVPLQFLNALLSYLGDSVSYGTTSSGLTSPLACCPSPSFSRVVTPSEGIVRWKLRLEYFAYETLQDLRIAKLFEIIVDYPESSPAIEDLKQCLEYTGQHSKLVESFISSLKYRLLTAGASTNDILHQYVSTIKALRAIDPAGVFLEAVGEPIRDYLRGRKDTIKCIVTMLTDGSGGNANGSGNPGDSLLEELMRDEESQENVGFDDDFHTDDKQAWINASRWEPDPVEADPLKGSLSQRKVDILGMLVDIIGSKEQLVNEYRVMLAEKLLNKTDYDIDTEIRTVELLKIHFGEASMQRCEIMLNDLIDSKRVNTNIKKASQTGAELRENELSVDTLTSTILSTNFWPPIQDEPLELPGPVDKLLSDYANRYHEIKTPRKLLWKKNLGTVKLELQFEDRAMQFTVSPTHAAIIMQFQEKKSWTYKDLAEVIGIPIDALNRRVNFWISKGVLRESTGANSNSSVLTLVESITDSGKNEGEELLTGEEEGETSIASVEDQLRKEMTIYEKFIMGMLTNFGSMALERIHNTLKMFCVADPSYDKSLQQLQSFLSGLVSEEKLEFRDGMYLLKK